MAAKTDSAADPAFVVETATTLLEIADEGLAALVARRVSQFLPADKAAEFLRLRKEAAWGDRELELLKRSIEEIVKKYDWASRYGPEILLGLLLAQYGVRQARVFAALSRMENQFVAARRNGTRTEPAAPAVNEKKPDAPAVPPVAKTGDNFPGPGDVIKPGAVTPPAQ